MKINQIIINEMTTAGAVATVAKPMGETQKRPEVAGLKPVDKIAKAKKKGPYANSLVEGAMKDFDIQRQDYQRMTPQQFFAAYKMTKQEWLAKNKQLLQQKPVAESKKLADKLTAKLKKNVEQHNKKKKETDEKVKQHQKDKVDEAELQEDDLVIIPGQGIKRKTGFVQKGQSRVDHEVEMARSDVLATMKNAKAIYKLLQDRSEDEGIEGWVQEKLIKANDYLNAVKEYYDEKMMQEAGVIAGGGVGESSLEEIDRRGFLKGMGASALGAAGMKAKAGQSQNLGNGFELVTIDVAGHTVKAVLDTQTKTYYTLNRNESGSAILRSPAPFIMVRDGKVNTTMSVGPETMAAMKKAGLEKMQESMAENQQPVRPLNPPQPVKKKPMTPFGPGQQKVDEKFASQQQAKLMYATAGGADTGVSKKVAKEFIKKSHGQKVKDLPKKVKKG